MQYEEMPDERITVSYRSWTGCWLSHSWWCWTGMEDRPPCCSLQSRTTDGGGWCWCHCSVSGHTRTDESTPRPTPPAAAAVTSTDNSNSEQSLRSSYMVLYKLLLSLLLLLILLLLTDSVIISSYKWLYLWHDLSTIGDRAFPIAAARTWNSLPS